MRKWGMQEQGVFMGHDRRKLSLKAEEFIKRVISGERDFSYISLKPGCDLSKYDSYNEMNSYLASQELDKSPLVLTGSELLGIVAPRLYAPHVKADCTHFGSAVLPGANFAHGTFCSAHFEEGSKLYYANLAGANFDSADMEADFWLADLAFTVFHGAKLGRSNFSRANVYKARFSGADLMRIVNLKDADNAHTADFTGAKVGAELKDYLAGILENEARVIIEVEVSIGKKA